MPAVPPKRLPIPALVLLAPLFVTSCMVGPDFEPPGVPWLDGWSSDALQAAQEEGQPPKRMEGDEWWRNFDDPVLEQLVEEAQRLNPGVRTAGMRILEARAQLGIAGSGLYPQLQQLNANALRVRNNQTDGPDFEFWTAGLGIDVGWELDFWGKFRRGIESADAGYFASIAQYDDIQVLVAAQAASFYTAIRTIEMRLLIAHENAALQERSLEITERLFRSGNESELDVQQARTLYLSTLATIPELEASLRQTQNALGVLLGRPPGPLPEMEAERERIPEADLGILADVPADLLRRRPDVRAAELQMAAQSARIGVSESELYPAIALTGSVVVSATSLAGQPKTLSYGLGPVLVWNIFDWGRLTNAGAGAGRPLPATLRAVPGHRAASGKGAGRCGDRLRASSRPGHDPRGSGAGRAPLPRHRRRAVPRGPRRLRESAGLAACTLQPAGAPRDHERRRRAEPDHPLQGDGRWLAGGPREAHPGRRDA